MSSIDVSGANSVRVICGPTGAGKSALAIELAERYDAIILSADSRQIYRGFDVGTAKPTTRDQSRVPHRGIDVADPAERYSAARWAAEACSWMADAHAAGRPVVIVGGTGFYLRALTEPLFDAPPVDPVRRAALEAMLRSISTDELRQRLVATLTGDGIDAVALNASSASEAAIEAKAKGCTYILYTDISTFKAPSTGKRIGGLLGGAIGAGGGGAGKAEAKLDFRLVPVGGTSPKLQSSASGKEETSEASINAALQEEVRAIVSAIGG